MIKNVFENKTIIIDDFFANPKKVISLMESVEYFKSSAYPGIRSLNLLESPNEEIRNFALYFTKRIADHVFYGIKNISIDIRFHINEVSNNDWANCGWIHNDPCLLAGLVYLNNSDVSLKNGTSLYDLKPNIEFDREDYESRQKFNTTLVGSNEYKKDLQDNHDKFIETARVGNKFNRLIAYDASMWHRPNNFLMKDRELRKSLLFFIEKYDFELQKTLLKIEPKWFDL